MCITIWISHEKRFCKITYPNFRNEMGNNWIIFPSNFVKLLMSIYANVSLLCLIEKNEWMNSCITWMYNETNIHLWTTNHNVKNFFFFILFFNRKKMTDRSRSLSRCCRQLSVTIASPPLYSRSPPLHRRHAAMPPRPYIVFPPPLLCACNQGLVIRRVTSRGK